MVALADPGPLRPLRGPGAAPAARTLDAWSGGLLAYWTTTGRRGVGNGPTEATNALIKEVKRVGRGRCNFDNYRLRLLLAVGLGCAPSPGRLRLPPRSEAAHHARWRRAGIWEEERRR